MTDLDVRPLNLSRAQLGDVRRVLSDRIREGLAAPGKEIAALPSYIAVPDRKIRGSALVIDVGGTNMRAAVVELDQGKAKITHGPLKKRLTVREASTTAKTFFSEQAALAEELSVPRGLPVGYCFSYPSENTPAHDGRLIRWTKGIDIPGVEGTLVGAQLLEALAARGVDPRGITVLNDTVASLLGGAYTHDVVPAERFVGLIVGTGTNMAAFFGKAAVNLESGNYHPPHLSAYDDALDRDSDDPGRQRFEKAVSGYYLPFLFDRVLPNQTGFDPRLGSATLVDFRDRGLENEPRIAADALLSRSADLVAAALAGVIDLYPDPKDKVAVLAEGSLIWSDPKYAPRVADTLAQLLGSAERVKLLKTEDADLIGSACAALGA